MPRWRRPADARHDVHTGANDDAQDGLRVGLGLHIVYNIVTNRLGGRIDLDTTPGEGTRIRMIVPREAPLELDAQ